MIFTAYAWIKKVYASNNSLLVVMTVLYCSSGVIEINPVSLVFLTLESPQSTDNHGLRFGLFLFVNEFRQYCLDTHMNYMCFFITVN